MLEGIDDIEAAALGLIFLWSNYIKSLICNDILISVT